MSTRKKTSANTTSLTSQDPWVLEMSTPMRLLGSDPRVTIIADNLGSPSNASCVADARLMSAAPELLKAVKALMNARVDDLGHALALAEAAINKAGGNQ